MPGWPGTEHRLMSYPSIANCMVHLANAQLLSRFLTRACSVKFIHRVAPCVIEWSRFYRIILKWGQGCVQGTVWDVAEKFDLFLYSEHSSASKMAAYTGGLNLQLKELFSLAEPSAILVEHNAYYLRQTLKANWAKKTLQSSIGVECSPCRFSSFTFTYWHQIAINRVFRAFFMKLIILHKNQFLLVYKHSLCNKKTGTMQQYIKRA